MRLSSVASSQERLPMFDKRANPTNSHDSWEDVWKFNKADRKHYSALDCRQRIAMEKIGTYLQLGIDFLSSDRVLEAGCGDASIVLEVVRLFNVNGYAVDFSESSVNSAKNNAFNKSLPLDIRLNNVTNMDFEDAFFEKVISMGVVEHLPDPRLAIRESFRVLRSGGLLILMTPNRYSFGRLERRIKQSCGLWPFGYQDEFSTKQLAKFCVECGFIISSSKTLTRTTQSSYSKSLQIVERADRFLFCPSNNWGFYSYVIAEKP